MDMLAEIQAIVTRLQTNEYCNILRFDETPRVGLIATNSVSCDALAFLIDDGIDIDCHVCNDECDGCDSYDHEYAIGDWAIGNDGKLSPCDGDCGFSAIVLPSHWNCIQVVQSETIGYGAIASPCFPNQVDMDSPGNLKAYTLPAWVFCDDDDHGLEEYEEYRAIVG